MLGLGRRQVVWADLPAETRLKIVGANFDRILAMVDPAIPQGGQGG
jgi:hypothetical protein